MKGSEQKLVAFMQGSDKRFVIPVYQRNYDWKTENCKRLFDDLKKVALRQRKTHFFGSIVSVYNPDGQFNEFQVIDGQQRLTTISLLLLAMYNLMQKGIVTAENKKLADMIYKTYLIDEWQDEDSRLKLKPVKNDRLAFNKLFGSETDYIQESNLTSNYRYFYDRIQNNEVSVDTLYDAIRSLEIISIQLNQDDNPQLIFESLNSTGLALSEGDKIRNLILMGLPSRKQNDYYEKYWNKIEECTDYDVSTFIRNYLSVKQQAIPSINKVYSVFRDYVDETAIETKDLLDDMLFYARLYEILIKANTANKELNACIYRLNRLETTVTRPFFLEVLRLHAVGTLQIEEVADIFLTTENFLFRRVICELPTNALNKIFMLLHREIVRFDGTEDDYVAKFKFSLLSKRENSRFPNDAEFVEAFENRQIYQMNSKNKIYMLERFENHGTVEERSVYQHFDDGEYSIEHIMPQHLTPAWIQSLGEGYEETHRIWLHRIANLTLTAYNSKYGNSPFAEKKTMRNGYIESGLRMNQRIAQCENWASSELEERNHYLMERALEIWAMPTTTFAPIEKQVDSCTLDEDVTLSGRLISRFSYKNTEQPVLNWADMFERVMRLLHSEDKTVLPKLAADKNAELAVYVSFDKNDLRSYSEIEEGLFIERNTSTWLKVSLLRRFFKLYGLIPQTLCFICVMLILIATMNDFAQRCSMVKYSDNITLYTCRKLYPLVLSCTKTSIGSHAAKRWTLFMHVFVFFIHSSRLIMMSLAFA